VGLSVGLEAVVKRNISSPYRESNPNHEARSLLAIQSYPDSFTKINRTTVGLSR